MDLEAEKAYLLKVLKNNGIRDDLVLQAMYEVPRELFVGEAMRDRAWENVALPIERGQTISQPFVVAYMTEALQLTDRHRVLEIGTGSGYQAAILAKICRRVYTLERHRPLYNHAVKLFDSLDLGKVTPKFGDGNLGWPEQAPFDRIIITAAAPEVPEALINQLAPGGILVAPIGPSHFNQALIRILKGEGTHKIEELLPVRFVPLLEGVEESD